MLGDHLRDLPGEADIACAPVLLGAPVRVEPPHRLCVEADAGSEPEAPPVDAAERDPPRCARCDVLGGRDRVAGQAERARQNVRPSAGDEADRRVGPDPVQHLIECAVAREDVDGLGVSGRAGELGRVARVLRPRDLDIAERAEHLVGPLVADAARERVDDQQPHRSEA